MAVATPYREALSVDTSDMARALQDTLGQKLVAYMVGVSDPVTVGRWANGRSNPSTANADRLREIFQIAQELLAVEKPSLVRAWFVGMNPDLGFSPPAQLVAEGQAQKAMTAARNFVQG